MGDCEDEPDTFTVASVPGTNGTDSVKIKFLPDWAIAAGIGVVPLVDVAASTDAVT